jgi:Type ISP C-terminal specificity domain/N-6 DNA Methylase
LPETNPILAFLTDVRDTHASGVGVKETSYYPAIANLFNSLGKKLKVRCIIHPHSIGAGLPDGALITTDQKSKLDDPLAEGMIPSRGVMEIKSPGEDAHKVAASEQVKKYVAKYGLVLVTTLRQFVIVARVDGDPKELESFTIAHSEKEFWKAVAHPKALDESIGPLLTEYLLRALLHNAPLATPKEVAWFLASYAREAKVRIDQKATIPSLAAVRAALEQALGLKFTGPKGEHFFRSSLVQTLFYGVFSAWVLWSKRKTTKSKDKFNWHDAAWSLHVPAIKTLFEHLATHSKLEELGLEEILNWTEAALNRVDRSVFFKNFEEKHAVQYFYEPFLAAYDPVLRKRMGVWFTPPEIVEYMVSRIDQVLQNEMGVSGGFANPNVLVLDPCCGTGAFLVQVLRLIHERLKSEGGDALTADDIKTAAMERVFGFEIIPAPFVVSHLQLGLLLQDIGAPLSPKLHERVGVYLTNALTGWNPTGPKTSFFWPELEEERDASELVKRDKKILVVLGNPPYYAFAGVSPEEEEGLVEPYKKGLFSEWKIRKYNLNELYVRFLRLAERRIAEKTKRGIVCYVSSYSYLSDPSFVVVRKRFCDEFQYAWIDCLNGDSRETGKRTPDGKPDPSVFSTEYNKAGIRLGTSIGLFAKLDTSQAHAVVRYRDFWGADKRADLLKTLDFSGDFSSQYEYAHPEPQNRYAFRPITTEAEYLSWPTIAELAQAEPISGLAEMRRGALMSHSKEALAERMQQYFDSTMEWAEYAALGSSLAEDAGRFNAQKARTKVLENTKFDEKYLVRYALYPMDNRWAYYSAVRPLWNEPRPELLAQRPEGESFLVIRRFAERPKEGNPAFFTSALPDYHLLRPNAVAIPLRLTASPTEISQGHVAQTNLYASHTKEISTANLSPDAREYLSTITEDDPDKSADLSRLIWLHSLAITYSPLYLSEHASGLKGDWPHIPLPDTLKQLQSSAELGATVSKILDVEKSPPGITGGKPRKELNQLGRITGPAGFSLSVTAGWGHLQNEEIVMPGAGLTKERDFSNAEKDAIEEGVAELGISLDDALSIFGGSAVDVYLNAESYWAGVPKATWDYPIGGYLVLKKWLSYREDGVLGRAITKEEVREFTLMVRRISALLLMAPSLDANYIAAKSATYLWPQPEPPDLEDALDE